MTRIFNIVKDGSKIELAHIVDEFDTTFRITGPMRELQNHDELMILPSIASAETLLKTSNERTGYQRCRVI